MGNQDTYAFDLFETIAFLIVYPLDNFEMNGVLSAARPCNIYFGMPFSDC